MQAVQQLPGVVFVFESFVVDHVLELQPFVELLLFVFFFEFVLLQLHFLVEQFQLVALIEQ